MYEMKMKQICIFYRKRNVVVGGTTRGNLITWLPNTNEENEQVNIN